MRDPARIARITEKLHRLWSLSPDQRLGQLLINALSTELLPPASDHVALHVWRTEDDRWEAALDRSIEEARRQVTPAYPADLIALPGPLDPGDEDHS